MNIVEDYFWKANIAFQINRLYESYEFICQAIQDLTHLTLEQIELIWLVIPSIKIRYLFFLNLFLFVRRNHYKSTKIY
jgi:hypothetical protein